MRDLILQLSKSSIYSTKPIHVCRLRHGNYYGII
ncbi:ankyrin repeat domain-containing protein, partial [Escherichia coli]|nr:ankyrin repeat domain-containing protein [Escherichia coli]